MKDGEQLGEAVLCFHRVGPRAQTQAARLSGKVPLPAESSH